MGKDGRVGEGVGGCEQIVENVDEFLAEGKGDDEDNLTITAGGIWDLCSSRIDYVLPNKSFNIHLSSPAITLYT